MNDISELTRRLDLLRDMIAREAQVSGDGLLKLALTQPGMAERSQLHVYSVGWRIEFRDELIVGIDDDLATRDRAISILDGRVLSVVTVAWPTMDTTFGFGEVRLRVFPVTSVADQRRWAQWSLRSPTGVVLDVGPGASWSMRRSRP